MPSAQGHKWALCVIDDCTRWPAVYLLKSLTAKATCQAFMELFLLTGWPRELCTDQGSNFCSQLTQEFLNRMGVLPRINSTYHPEVTGVIERFNASFKTMMNHKTKTANMKKALLLSSTSPFCQCADK